MSRKEALQQGHFVDVLGQTKWWRSGAGTMVKRKNMGIDHKANTLAFLIREAKKIVDGYATHPVFLWAPDDVWAELEHMQDDPQAWIFKQPFVKALIRDLFNEAGMGPHDIGMRHSLSYPQAWLEQ